MIVRDATPADGVALLQAMENCPQGNDLVISLTNQPDFFSRSRVYEHARVFMAEEDGQVAGSAAYTIRTVQVDGRPVRVGYEFQYFVAPEFRRHGVASILRDQIDAGLIADGAEVTTAIVICSNLPSVRLFERNGFTCERVLSASFLLPAVHADMRVWPSVRPARPADLPAIARLNNASWAASDYFNPQTASELAATIERTPGCSLETTYVLEDNGEIVATAGIWRWRDVQQINVISIDEFTRQRLPGVEAGESWRHWGLTTIGFRHADDMTRLLQTLGNTAHAAGIDQMGIVVDPAHALADAIRPFPTFDIQIGFFVKPLNHADTSINRPVFIDVSDI